MAAINPGNRNNPETALSPAPAVQSPRHAAGESVGSPQSRSKAAPWTHIVRGESEPTITPSSQSTVTEQAASFSPSQSSSPPSLSLVEDSSVVEGSENGGGTNGNAGRKPAWNKPSNGAIEVGPVMGAVSWPALSDAARASTKSSSSESLKGVSDASLSVSVAQGVGTATISSPKQVSSSSTPTNSGPTRQRSMKQRNNASASSNGGAPQHQTPAGQGVEVTSNNPSPKEHRGAFASQSHNNNDHPQQRTSFRNRTGGPHPRGDGSHHHNFGGRHQDRGRQEWNNHRNFNNRDNHLHPQRVVPRAMRPQALAPSNAPPFMPQPMRSFGPLGFDYQGQLVYPPPDQLVPFMLPRAPLFFVGPDLQLHHKIINQIDYYFSNENLIKDAFLRRNMDDQGWVCIKLIAGFNKVMNLTENIQIILDALRMSAVVEVQGDKIRRRNDWMRWVMPAAQPPAVTSSQPLGKSGNDMLSAHIQSISLDEKTTNNKNIQNDSQPQPSSGDEAGQFSVQGGADCSISARN